MEAQEKVEQWITTYYLYDIISYLPDPYAVATPGGGADEAKCGADSAECGAVGLADLGSAVPIVSLHRVWCC